MTPGIGTGRLAANPGGVRRGRGRQYPIYTQGQQGEFYQVVPYAVPAGHPSSQPQQESMDYDGESGSAKSFNFTDKSIRRAFVRKVYSLLMIQLLITTSFISFFTFHEPTKIFIRAHFELVIICIVIFLVCMFIMMCCGQLLRNVPFNYIFLFIFTVAESFFLGILATFYAPLEVLMAVGITVGIVLGLTLFAFQTKIDFTPMYGIMFVVLLCFMIFGIIAIFIPGSKILTLVYSSLGALIFSIYLVMDTQFIMGGKHKYSISPEEYVFAALMLYIDVVNIFTYILSIIGAARS